LDEAFRLGPRDVAVVVRREIAAGEFGQPCPHPVTEAACIYVFRPTAMEWNGPSVNRYCNMVHQVHRHMGMSAAVLAHCSIASYVALYFSHYDGCRMSVTVSEIVDRQQTFATRQTTYRGSGCPAIRVHIGSGTTSPASLRSSVPRTPSPSPAPRRPWRPSLSFCRSSCVTVRTVRLQID
jgi:hypothetical protein